MIFTMNGNKRKTVLQQKRTLSNERIFYTTKKRGRRIGREATKKKMVGKRERKREGRGEIERNREDKNSLKEN